MKNYTFIFVIIIAIIVSCKDGKKVNSSAANIQDTTVVQSKQINKYEYLKKCSVYAIKKECKNKMQDFIDKQDEFKTVAPDFALTVLPVAIRVKDRDYKISSLYAKYKESMDSVKKVDEDNPPAYFIGTLYHFVNHFKGDNTTEELTKNAIDFCNRADRRISAYDMVLESINNLRNEMMMP